MSTSSHNLSMDARVLLTAWFLNGQKTKVEVGGTYAKSRLTHRAQAAIDELVATGHITASAFNDTGRMLYQGTDKRGARLSLADMEKYGAWSPTEANPLASAEMQNRSTMTLRLTSGAD